MAVQLLQQLQLYWSPEVRLHPGLFFSPHTPHAVSQQVLSRWPLKHSGVWPHHLLHHHPGSHHISSHLDFTSDPVPATCFRPCSCVICSHHSSVRGPVKMSVTSGLPSAHKSPMAPITKQQLQSSPGLPGSALLMVLIILPSTDSCFSSNTPAMFLPLLFPYIQSTSPDPTGLTASLPSLHTAPPQRGLPWHSSSPILGFIFLSRQLALY